MKPSAICHACGAVPKKRRPSDAPQVPEIWLRHHLAQWCTAARDDYYDPPGTIRAASGRNAARDDDFVYYEADLAEDQPTGHDSDYEEYAGRRKRTRDDAHQAGIDQTHEMPRNDPDDLDNNVTDDDPDDLLARNSVTAADEGVTNHENPLIDARPNPAPDAGTQVVGDVNEAVSELLRTRTVHDAVHAALWNQIDNFAMEFLTSTKANDSLLQLLKSVSANSLKQYICPNVVIP